MTALSAGASDMSGWLLMGLPGALYAGRRVRSLDRDRPGGRRLVQLEIRGRRRCASTPSAADNALTLPDYFTHRFEDNGRLLRILSALVILVFFAVYCASRHRRRRAPVRERVRPAVRAGAVVRARRPPSLYTLIGGFLAVSWTDTVQATLMIFALILTPVIVILGTGGLGDSLALIEQVDPAKLDWFKGASVVGIVSLLAWGLGYVGQPHILARFMAAESLAAIPPARAHRHDLDGAVPAGRDGHRLLRHRLFRRASRTRPARSPPTPSACSSSCRTLLFNPWIAGVLLSAILAAIMSTLSCQLLVCSSAMTEDFYKRLPAPEAPGSANWCGWAARRCWRWRCWRSGWPAIPTAACSGW